MYVGASQKEAERIKVPKIIKQKHRRVTLVAPVSLSGQLVNQDDQTIFI